MIQSVFFLLSARHGFKEETSEHDTAQESVLDGDSDKQLSEDTNTKNQLRCNSFRLFK